MQATSTRGFYDHLGSRRPRPASVKFPVGSVNLGPLTIRDILLLMMPDAPIEMRTRHKTMLSLCKYAFFKLAALPLRDAPICICISLGWPSRSCPGKCARPQPPATAPGHSDSQCRARFARSRARWHRHHWRCGLGHRDGRLRRVTCGA